MLRTNYVYYQLGAELINTLYSLRRIELIDDWKICVYFPRLRIFRMKNESCGDNLGIAVDNSEHFVKSSRKTQKFNVLGVNYGCRYELT